jgi:hypothetical protein
VLLPIYSSLINNFRRARIAMPGLILPSSFEDITAEFPEGDVNAKLMQFVEPVPHIEAEINYISAEVKNTGKVVFIFGAPGTGKSTFIQSLSWRTHIRIRAMVQINAADVCANGNLDSLFVEIQKLAPAARQCKDAGPTCVVVNYLENLVEYDDDDVKGFFRKLNGALRNAPILVIWPVTDKDDVEHMLSYAAAVSDTLFCRGKAVINFPGPSRERFADIAKCTISVLNNGRDLTEFSLTTDDLEEELGALGTLPRIQQTMREYIELIKLRWRKNTNYQGQITSSIPKSLEVWFVFSYKGAESVVGQFCRKSHRVEDAWSAIHDKFYEYIHDNQRSSIWDAKRLQLALYGAIKTRVMYLPTNTLVSCVAAYTQSSALCDVLDSAATPPAWKKKNKVRGALSNTPMYKQIVGDPCPVGKRKGGPAAEAIRKADPIFAEIVKWISGGGGSDKEINRCVAQALDELCPYNVESEKPHPWLPSIIPDIFIDLPERQICIEFHHTNRDEPGVVADYVLKKLDVYMNQITSLISPRGV